MTKAEELNPAAIVLPKGILMEDFCIIDEQEDHVVLTLRIPIDWIRDNLPTLMALSEIATGKPRYRNERP